jgi:hypothetical protein
MTNAAASGTLTVTGASTLVGTTATSTLSIGASGTAIQQLIIVTVSPSSGVATVTNAAITVTTIPSITMLSSAGTVVTSSYNPQMHAGSMSFTVGSLDTSTYSVILFVK